MKVNIKQEFAKWLLENAPGSYNHYLGNTINSVIERLDEISAFYPKHNFFDIDPSEVDKNIKEIKYTFSNKERIKNPDFLKYDKDHSNGIPKAVMGKNNYLKFLEKSYQNFSNLSYWLFQGNPKIFDFKSALADKSLDSFTVSAHKDKIKVGDKVIIWLTGQKAGCYALAEITSEPSIEPVSSDDKHWKQDNSNDLKAGIKITHNLYENPILWENIKKLDVFSDFNAGNQGTNFSATKSQYETLLKMTIEEKFTWVKTHKEIVNFLKEKQGDQKRLIELLESVGIDPFNDQNPKNNQIRLEEIDPFTFFAYIYKYGSAKRLELLQSISKKINVFYPKDDKGIRSANAQKVWFFPFKFGRTSNEVPKLWEFFNKALDNSITNDLFDEVLKIKNIAATKITEGLFYIMPENYFPINGPSKPFLKYEFGINPEFKTFTEYQDILKQLRTKTKTPFYQLSYEAALWKQEKKNEEYDFETVVDQFSQDDLLTYFNLTDEIVDHLNLSQGDQRMVYSCGKTYLNINIGQRFVWRLKPKKGKKFWIMTKEKLEPNYKIFHEQPEHYYHLFNDKSEIDKSKASFFEAIKIELERSTNSGFLKYNDGDFEKAVFDKSYRAQFLELKKMKKPTQSLNQILFGPPGTGKTFKLQSEYFKKFTQYSASTSRENYLKEEVEKLAWWQVLYIALLDLGKVRVNDILAHPSVQAKAKLSTINNLRASVWGALQRHTTEDCPNVGVVSRAAIKPFWKTDHSEWHIHEDENLELFPEAKQILETYKYYDETNSKEIENYSFVTFHQSFTYEDFVEGIKPVLDDETDDIKYEISNGIFKKLALKAQDDPDNDYAIFIDEINRGNVASIFGELITLIEKDKRQGAENELSVILPYSKTKFSVPQNLHIIGTMNTADRSVEALDTALRRRFSFIEMPPLPEVIMSNGKADVGMLDGIELPFLLQTINTRIEKLLDKDHKIGHSYFLSVKSLEDLRKVFRDNVIPLLEEYFFGDYGKIGLVLGNSFIRKTEDHEATFAAFDGYDESIVSDLNQREVYEIKPMDMWDFKSIYL